MQKLLLGMQLNLVFISNSIKMHYYIKLFQNPLNDSSKWVVYSAFLAFMD